MQPGTVMLVSSANIFVQDISRQLGRSFMEVLCMGKKVNRHFSLNFDIFKKYNNKNN